MSLLQDPDFLEVIEGHDVLKIDGYDSCVIGVTDHSLQPQLVYSAARILNQLMADDGLDDVEALAYYEFNIIGGLPNKPAAPVILLDY